MSATGGPPPRVFGFRPPPPQQQGGFAPSAPRSVASRTNSFDSEYSSSDGGALTSTINMVTSAAASVFFKPPPPSNQPPPPMLTQQQSPRKPPPPIEPTSSMLDDTPILSRKQPMTTSTTTTTTTTSVVQQSAKMFRPPPPNTPTRGVDYKKSVRTSNNTNAAAAMPRTIPTIPSLPSEPATPKSMQYPPPRLTKAAAAPAVVAAADVFGSEPPKMPEVTSASQAVPAPRQPSPVQLEATSALELFAAPKQQQQQSPPPQELPVAEQQPPPTTNADQKPSQATISSRLPPVMPPSKQQQQQQQKERMTPPPSPKPNSSDMTNNVLLSSLSPKTPLRTNTTSTAASAAAVETGVAASVATTPSLQPTPVLRRLNLPTPTKRVISPTRNRRLRLPLPPKSSSKQTPRTKFRLPPPRKTTTAGAATTTIASTTTTSSATAADDVVVVANDVNGKSVLKDEGNQEVVLRPKVAAEPPTMVTETSGPEEVKTTTTTEATKTVDAASPMATEVTTTTVVTTEPSSGPPTMVTEVERTTTVTTESGAPPMVTDVATVDVGPSQPNGTRTPHPISPPSVERTQEAPPMETAAATAAEEQEEGPLPPAWMETTDPTTGKVYFYNTTTQETSWDRPQRTSNDISRHDLEPSPATDTTMEILEQMRNHPEATTTEDAIVDDDSIPTTEPTAENDAGGVEDSTSATAAAEDYATPATAPIAESDTRGMGPALPPDWAEVVDPASGNVYYYNSMTQESSWERPSKGVPQVPMLREEDSVEQEDLMENETTPAPRKMSKEESIEATFALLNAEFGYEEPPPKRKDVQIAAKDDEDEVAAPKTSITPEESPNDDWTEAVDPVSGQTYYYNTVTQETVWERPSSMLARDQNDIKPSKEKIDPAPGTDTTIELLSLGTNKEEALGSPGSDSLPAGWTKVTDPDSGNVYYYNTLTEETSWDFPKSTEDDSGSQESDSAPEQTDLAGNLGDQPEVSGFEENAAAAADDDMDEDQIGADNNNVPEPWVATLDESSGLTYYYNPETMETSWDKPVAAATAPEEDVNAEPLNNTEGIPPESPEEPEVPGLADDANDGVDGTLDVVSGEGGEIPDEWVETVDPSTGGVYYFNSLTQETSWEKPMSRGDPALVATGSEIAEESSAENIADKAEPAAGEECEEQADATSEWVEAIDSAGAKYYYNTTTQETSWEKPASFLAAEAGPDGDEAPEVTSSSMAPQNLDLPAHALGPSSTNSVENDLQETATDWVAMTDESSGKVYYYNSATQETSWENPKGKFQGDSTITSREDPNSETMPNTGRASHVNGLESTGAFLEDSGESSEVVEPNGTSSEWVATFDESNGQTYYYNTVTKETTWEKPTSSVKDKANAVVEPGPMVENEFVGDEDGDADSIEGASDKDDPVSSEWVATVDETSGQTYYFNTVTQETSWEKPISVVRSEIEPESEVAGDDTPAVEEYALANGESKGNESDIPVGWEEVVDETGATYYFNPATQETSWEKPLDEQSPAVASDSEPEPKVVDDNTAGVSSQDLPLGWEEVIDETTGKTYYYHKATQETSWEMPLVEDPPAVANDSEREPKDVDDDTAGIQEEECAATDAESQGNESDIPFGWEEVVDETSGETYYFNPSTQETSWEKPLVKAPPVVASESDPEHEVVVADTLAQAATNSEPQKDESDIPLGWENVVDETSGETYYYNPVTQETSWDKPLVESPP
eukprot:scaffold15772_cov162-Cylindrotheca_fusiformis.AAC.8